MQLFAFVRMDFIKIMPLILARRYAEIGLFIYCNVMMEIIMMMMDALINVLFHKGLFVKS